MLSAIGTTMLDLHSSFSNLSNCNFDSMILAVGNSTMIDFLNVFIIDFAPVGMSMSRHRDSLISILYLIPSGRASLFFNRFKVLGVRFRPLLFFIQFRQPTTFHSEIPICLFYNHCNAITNSKE